MKVLVTGGAGFIGSHLVDMLVEHGHDVMVVDDLSTGSMDNLSSSIDKIGFVCADVSKLFMHELKGVEVVFHLAAFVSVPKSVEDPMEAYNRGAHMTALLLENCRKNDVKRFVFASSCSVYESLDTPKPRNEGEALCPLSPYAAGKACGEMLVNAYAMCYPMDGVSLRFFNVYGPRQSSNSSYSGVVARFCAQAVSGAGFEIFGDGQQSRDFIYVVDVARACYLAGVAPKRLNGVALNVGTGRAESVISVADAIDKTLPRKHLPPRAGEVRSIKADNEWAKNFIGFSPIVGFEEGVRATVGWYEQRT